VSLRDDLRKHFGPEPYEKRIARAQEDRNAARFKTADLTPPVLTMANALGAGLPRDMARDLAAASELYPGAVGLRRGDHGITKQQRAEVCKLCVAVVNVVGMGYLDKRLLNHRIRDVLRSCVDAFPIRSTDASKYARRLCWIYAQPGFLRQASTFCEQLSPPCEMTRNWLRDGGSLAHWFSLSVLMGASAQVDIGEGVLGSLDLGVGIAMRYIR
jgi:hypothetical protein